MNKTKHYLNKAQSIVERVFGVVAGVLLAVMTVCIFWQVICRYLLHMSNNWTEEVTRYAGIAMVFLGSAVATAQRKNINLDFMEQTIKGLRGKRILMIVCDVATFLILLVLIKWSWDYLIYNINSGAKTFALHFPYALPVSTMFISFVFSAIFLLIHLLNAIFSTDESALKTATPDEEG